eukprot:3837934-Prymnesium_polylepis.1
MRACAPSFRCFQPTAATSARVGGPSSRRTFQGVADRNAGIVGSSCTVWTTIELLHTTEHCAWVSGVHACRRDNMQMQMQMQMQPSAQIAQRVQPYVYVRVRVLVRARVRVHVQNCPHGMIRILEISQDDP